MNRHFFGCRNRTKRVHRIANHIHDASQGSLAYRYGDGATKINGLHSAHHAFSGFHGNATHPAFTEMLLHFQDYADGLRDFEALAGDPQRLINRRQRGLCKLDVHGGSGDLNYFSGILWHLYLKSSY